MDDAMLSGLILSITGLFVFLGAILNWRLVTRSGKLFNILLGDAAARVIYGGIGAVLMIFGILQIARS